MMELIIDFLCYLFVDAGIEASTSHKLPKPVRIICCVLISLALLAVIVALAAVAIIFAQDMLIISILLGALAILTAFLLIGIIRKSLKAGKRKK